MPGQSTKEIADTFWANFLGCQIEDFARPQVTVVPHATLAGYLGLWVFRRQSSAIISAPPALVDNIAAAVGDLTVTDLFTELALHQLFGDAIARVIGPAAICYADQTSFCPIEPRNSRLLTTTDTAAVLRLSTACGEEEWSHAGLELGKMPVFGCFAETGDLAAAAGYELWGGQIAHIGVVTHPVHRSRGFAKAVVSAACEHGLGRGLLMQYRTLEANVPSMGVLRLLGFRQYAEHFAVRLRE